MSLTLVVIDDDELDRHALRRALTQTGRDFAIEECDSGEAGLERIRSMRAQGRRVDCLLLDFSLPGQNGLEVLSRLREQDIDVPTVMLTGFGDEELAVESMRRGADDYLPKAKLDPLILASKIDAARRIFDARQRTIAAETELRDLVEQLRRAVAARDSVLAVVSHDLRRPLNNIQLALGLIEQDATPRQRDLAVGSVRRAVDRANQLIGDLLEISRLDGEIELDRQPLDPLALAQAVVTDLEPVLARSDASLRIEHGDALDKIFADHHRVRQVLDNLLDNAISHSPKDGTIVLSLRNVSGAVEFSVRDQGPGIEPVVREHVFDRFWRGEGRPKGAGGVGLGLAIAKGFTEAHGGEIGVECPEDGGSRFWFRIPAPAPTPGQRGDTAGESASDFEGEEAAS
ncbi:hybrid sensor histidine kinase/response regulator [Pseudenhygromyxa sp. WMMC2535]|uniref:hybrid sensor histidine kinase/response regulator n=1 Tax=Pseudenhygromyxa sp. WMMC2535 TaxID=2712867 RepID=UPI001556C13F|nr:hybrid sensor histidine kinase/response regulator [Pseudenhygromyxa sp. WMMC2535]NVB37064.1 hybrid sensor histidine kinase/response regulator [Pseudenhygromyxa sp. WMMC2535]